MRLFAASLHPKDAATGLVVGVLVLGVLAVALLVARSRTAASRPPIVAWSAVAAATAAAAALVPAVGRGIVGDVGGTAALAAALAAVVAGLGWHRLAQQVSLRWITVLATCTAAGVWAAVPDTEAAVTVLAAWAPFALVGVVADRPAADAPSWAWCALAVGPAWAAAWGTSAGDQALPGALACFGVALVAPWAATAVRGATRVGWLVPLHAVTVLAAARWAARADSVWEGVARGAVVLTGSAVAAVFSARRAGRARPRPSDPAVRPR